MELQAAAHLTLNIPKCIFIPLFAEGSEDIHASICRAAPTFQDVAIRDHGKYLGFHICPGKGDRSWLDALSKATKQVQAWSWGPLGLFFATVVWNTFIIPILGFVAQLEMPPSNIQDTIDVLLRRAAHGPGNWCTSADVLHLRRSDGLVAEYKDIRIIAKASMFRTTHLEDRWSGGLRAVERSDALYKAYRQTRYFDRSRDMFGWYDKAIVHQMADLSRVLKSEFGISRSQVERVITSSGPRPWGFDLACKVLSSFQKQATEQLLRATDYDGETEFDTTSNALACWTEDQQRRHSADSAR